MIAVIFEVYPEDERLDEYLGIAADLRPILSDTPGFISVERFKSLSNPEKYLSLSFFEDESAVLKWRNTAQHREAQSKGRRGVFTDYRLRVAEVIRDYGMAERKCAPADSRSFHDSDNNSEAQVAVSAASLRAPTIAGLATRAIALLRRVIQRNQNQNLSSFDPHMRRDIGL